MPQNDKQFVSRGGIKLQFAVENWQLEIENQAIRSPKPTGGYDGSIIGENWPMW